MRSELRRAGVEARVFIGLYGTTESRALSQSTSIMNFSATCKARINLIGPITRNKSQAYRTKNNGNNDCRSFDCTSLRYISLKMTIYWGSAQLPGINPRLVYENKSMG